MSARGSPIRLDGTVLRELTLSGGAPELHHLLLRYAQASINVLAQSAACDALHKVAERTARWLLQSHDRAGMDEFSLTQDFLARMPRVRRASVTQVALEFQDAGTITYTRGQIKVLNREALLTRSCECYGIMRDEYERVVQGFPKHTNGVPRRLPRSS